ncbi:MAG: hypothetical protein BJ554DRAFT_6445 [Olpidium bornovanus]|uniref:Uncharacterized protein n=1 Tax=Olpidium bornovanus TaxID=278681 RepID=A0A8H7ZY13_9FUNG|nr:MAG: hypothetical protein BJ554DRAFT_6445 [Olpidium bornovanus]
MRSAASAGTNWRWRASLSADHVVICFVGSRLAVWQRSSHQVLASPVNFEVARSMSPASECRASCWYTSMRWMIIASFVSPPCLSYFGMSNWYPLSKILSANRMQDGDVSCYVVSDVSIDDVCDDRCQIPCPCRRNQKRTRSWRRSGVDDGGLSTVKRDGGLDGDVNDHGRHHSGCVWSVY